MDTHQTDADCTVDPNTNLCTGCGVEHGEPCIECGGKGFHTAACTLEAEQRLCVGDTPDELLDPDSDEADALLDAAKEAQTVYWDALLALENALGISVDGTADLQGMTCKDLVESPEA